MESTRDANIAANNAFMEQLGFTSGGLAANNFQSTKVVAPGEKAAAKHRSREVKVAKADSIPPRQSQRLLQDEKKASTIGGYACRECNLGRIFPTIKGLNMHQKRGFCIALSNYKPNWSFQLTEEEKLQLFQPDDVEESRSSSFAEPKLMQSINQMVCENDDEQQNYNSISSDQENLIPTQEEDDPNDGIDMERLPLTKFQSVQEALCKYLYGEHYLDCVSYEEMILAVQTYYKQPNLSGKLHEQFAYNFVVEAGLSRKMSNKLLRVIRLFKPLLVVPKSIRGIETRSKRTMNKFQDCVKLTIPWIQNWQMNELKGFKPIAIFVRNLFEIISYMLIDPEIMFVWRDHIRMNYNRATDRENNHVYSDIMTSNWAYDTENLIRLKDNDGKLMPLVIYTDGVQVSANVHNKITPVIITLGNFSDILIQKDISKRVVAYLPNFKCYSKDMIISHIRNKLKISKSKVRHIL